MSEHYLLDGLPVTTYPFDLEKALEGCLVGLKNAQTKTLTPFFIVKKREVLWIEDLTYEDEGLGVYTNKRFNDEKPYLVLLQEEKRTVFHYKKVGTLWEVKFSITGVKSDGYTPSLSFSNLQAKRKMLNEDSRLNAV